MRTSVSLVLTSISATALAQFPFGGDNPFTSGFPFGGGNGPLPSGLPLGNGNGPSPSGFPFGNGGPFGGSGSPGETSGGPSGYPTGGPSEGNTGTGIYDRILTATDNAQETLRVLNLVTGAGTGANPIAYFIHFFEYLIGLEVLSAELNELDSLLNQLPSPATSTPSTTSPPPFQSSSQSGGSLPTAMTTSTSSTPTSAPIFPTGPFPLPFPPSQTGSNPGPVVPINASGIAPSFPTGGPFPIPFPPARSGHAPGPVIPHNASATAAMKFSFDSNRGGRKRPLGPGPVIIGGGAQNNGSQGTNSSNGGIEQRICAAYISFLGEDQTLAQALSATDASPSTPVNFPSQGNMDDFKNSLQQYFDLVDRISGLFEGLFPSCGEEVSSDQAKIDSIASTVMQKVP